MKKLSTILLFFVCVASGFARTIAPSEKLVNTKGTTLIYSAETIDTTFLQNNRTITVNDSTQKLDSNPKFIGLATTNWVDKEFISTNELGHGKLKIQIDGIGYNNTNFNANSFSDILIKFTVGNADQIINVSGTKVGEFNVNATELQPINIEITDIDNNDALSKYLGNTYNLHLEHDGVVKLIGKNGNEISFENSTFKFDNGLTINAENGTLNLNAQSVKINNKEVATKEWVENKHYIPYADNSSALTIGSRTGTIGNYSVVIGSNGTASADYSIAEGVLSRAIDLYSFVWNGKEGESYSSHGTGTFSINPKNGTSGFWIGNKTINDLIVEASNAGVISIRNLVGKVNVTGSDYIDVIDDNLSNITISNTGVTTIESLKGGIDVISDDYIDVTTNTENNKNELKISFNTDSLSLDDIHDVDASNPDNLQALLYDNTSSTWKPVTIKTLTITKNDGDSKTFDPTANDNTTINLVIPTDLNSIDDVEISDLNNGQSLVYVVNVITNDTDPENPIYTTNTYWVNKTLAKWNDNNISTGKKLGELVINETTNDIYVPTNAWTQTWQDAEHTDNRKEIGTLSFDNGETQTNIYIPNNVSAFNNDAGYLNTETDPTIYDWAKAETKPVYQYSEIQNTPINVSTFNNDAGYLQSFTETDPTIYEWAKAATKPTYQYSEIQNTPTNVSTFHNDVGYLTSFTETDPNIHAWARADSKPTYDYSEIQNTPTMVSTFENDAGYLTLFTEVDPTVNNGALTVRVNNAESGTFTANQSGNTLIDISVPTNLDDLSDVTFGEKTEKQVLTYNGTGWTNLDLPPDNAGVTNINGFEDYLVITNDGNTISVVNDTENHKVKLSLGTVSIGNLSDVTLAEQLLNYQVLSYNGTSWTNKTINDMSWDQLQFDGEQIATLTVNGEDIQIFVPENSLSDLQYDDETGVSVGTFVLNNSEETTLYVPKPTEVYFTNKVDNANKQLIGVLGVNGIETNLYIPPFSLNSILTVTNPATKTSAKMDVSANPIFTNMAVEYTNLSANSYAVQLFGRNNSNSKNGSESVTFGGSGENALNNAIGDNSFAHGSDVQVVGLSSHGEGRVVVVSNNYSHGDGVFVEVTNNYSYVWSGDYHPVIPPAGKERYRSHGDGTFNINPLEGVDGFWIGEHRFSEYIPDHPVYYIKDSENGYTALTSGSRESAAVGPYSIAIGSNVVASGNKSLAIGESYYKNPSDPNDKTQLTQATSTNAIAIGWGVSATAPYAVSIGAFSVASGTNAIAMGDNITASGTSAIGFGRHSTADGYGAIVVGDNATSSSTNSLAVGRFTEALADYSIAVGDHSRVGVKATNSVASGRYTDATNDYAYVWSGQAQENTTNNAGIVTQTNRYGTHGNGTFNIDPKLGLNGFYVGETNMYQHIVNIAGSGGSSSAPQYSVQTYYDTGDTAINVTDYLEQFYDIQTDSASETYSLTLEDQPDSEKAGNLVVYLTEWYVTPNYNTILYDLEPDYIDNYDSTKPWLNSTNETSKSVWELKFRTIPGYLNWRLESVKEYVIDQPREMYWFQFEQGGPSTSYSSSGSLYNSFNGETIEYTLERVIIASSSSDKKIDTKSIRLFATTSSGNSGHASLYNTSPFSQHAQKLSFKYGKYADDAEKFSGSNTNYYSLKVYTSENGIDWTEYADLTEDIRDLTDDMGNYETTFPTSINVTYIKIEATNTQSSNNRRINIDEIKIYM